MSLKAFHIFFIALAILISFGFAAWVFLGGAGDRGSTGLTLTGIASGVIGVGLIVYGIHFIRKARHIII